MSESLVGKLEEIHNSIGQNISIKILSFTTD